MIEIKRVYEPPARQDGRRFLVDRMWPRGVKKEALEIDAWLRDAAPSDRLRKWFGHRAERWAEFARRYQRELDEGAAWRPLLDAARRGDVTLLFAARDRVHNNASALADYLRGKLGGRERASAGAPARPRRGRSPGAAFTRRAEPPDGAVSRRGRAGRGAR